MASSSSPEPQVPLQVLALVLQGIDQDAINARAARKRKADAQLVGIAADLHRLTKQERQKRDELNSIVRAKRAMETDLVENLVALGHRGFNAADDMEVRLVPRRLDAPDQKEVKERLEDAGFSAEQIRTIQDALRDSKRIKYDVHVSMAEAEEGTEKEQQVPQQATNVVAGIVAAVEGQQ